MNGRELFQTVLLPKPKRSKFDLSHEKKMSIPFGALIPTLALEVLPGDSFRINQEVFVRFQALLAPVMHRVNVTTHFYFVPYRILSQDFTKMMNLQGAIPQAATNGEFPYFTIDSARNANVYGVSNALKDGSLLDYLGFPTAPNDTTLAAAGLPWYDQMRIQAFFPLAYQRIWSDHYRDQFYTQPLFSEDGTAATLASAMDRITVFDSNAFTDPEVATINTSSTRVQELLKLRWRAWEKDYLTSAAPTPNQGNYEPRVPVTVPAGALGNTPAVGTPVPSAESTFGRTGAGLPSLPNGSLTDNGGFTLTAVRVAAALKRWLENQMRGGTRYIESLWNHWHVKSSDARLQRSEYLGGGIQPLVLSEVVTTAPASSVQTGVPPGYLAGHGISYGTTNKMTRWFEEHGVVMAITSVLPRTSYLYSMPRAFMRSEPLDFAFPEFANLGEQQILGSEVMFKLNTTANSPGVPTYTAGGMNQGYTGIVQRFPMGGISGGINPYWGFDLQNQLGAGGTAWGFQSRYAEYKYEPDRVHGLFRNNLSFWHFGRFISPVTGLSNSFIQSNPRMDPFAVLPSNGGTGQYNQHPILMQVFNRVSVVRSLPYYNTPELW